MSRGAAVALALLPLAASPVRAQHLTIGPEGAVADYREVTAGLRYRGSGYGGSATARYRWLSAAASVVRLSFDPAANSTAARGFKATQVDAWVAYDVSRYLGFEAGIIRRTPDDDLEAQSFGAVRLGARSAYELGPGAVVSFRTDYLAAPEFSGGGRAPFALDIGLAVDVRFGGHVHATAAYQFQRVDRKTDPGGTGEIKVPIQRSLARFGLAVGF